MKKRTWLISVLLVTFLFRSAGQRLEGHIIIEPVFMHRKGLVDIYKAVVPPEKDSYQGQYFALSASYYPVRSFGLKCDLQFFGWSAAVEDTISRLKLHRKLSFRVNPVVRVYLSRRKTAVALDIYGGPHYDLFWYVGDYRNYILWSQNTEPAKSVTSGFGWNAGIDITLQYWLVTFGVGYNLSSYNVLLPGENARARGLESYIPIKIGFVILEKERIKIHDD